MMAEARRVLLVEDEYFVSMLIEAMLNDLGYEVGISVANLDDGLKAAADGNFDIAVLDINLHRSQSYPIADILVSRKVPFIFATGYAADSINPRYSKIPAVQKPFTIEALAKTLCRAFDDARPE